MDPPINDKVVPPATAATVPPHKLEGLTGFAIVIPGGKLSTHEALVKENGFGLRIITLSRDTPPDVIISGEKPFTRSAGTLTTSVAVAGSDVFVAVWVRVAVEVAVRVEVGVADGPISVNVAVGVTVKVGVLVRVAVG